MQNDAILIYWAYGTLCVYCYYLVFINIHNFDIY